MSFKPNISNILLSRLDVDYYKKLASSNRLINPFYRLISQSFIDYKFPKHLFIETSAICNLQCNMCTRITDKDKIGHMSFELFKKIIDEATDYGARSFSLHLFGEALLHPQIVEMVQYIKAANNKHTILLTTNGTKLSDDMYRDLAKAKVDRITVSVLAENKDTYEHITKSKRFDALEKSLRSVGEIRRREFPKGSRLYLRYLISDQTEGELEAFKAKWQKSGYELEIRPCHNLGGNYGETRISPDVFKDRWPCYHLWFAPGIFYNGEFTVCCDDPKRKMIIGNVAQTSIAEIWQGEEMQKFRQYHKSGQYEKMPLCKNCDVWSLYPDIFFKNQKG